MQVTQIADAIDATTTVTLTGAVDYYRHEIQVVTTGGTWTADVQASADGTVWTSIQAVVTLASTGEWIFAEAYLPHLRVVFTRTGGTLSAWWIRARSRHSEA